MYVGCGSSHGGSATSLPRVSAAHCRYGSYGKSCADKSARVVFPLAPPPLLPCARGPFSYFLFLKRKGGLQELPSGQKCPRHQWFTYGSLLSAHLPAPATPVRSELLAAFGGTGLAGAEGEPDRIWALKIFRCRSPFGYPREISGMVLSSVFQWQPLQQTPAS
jgi:hypothetical protein